MRCIAAITALAFLAVGCSEPTAPAKLHPSGPAFDGTPPPPPITGSGDADFSTTSIDLVPLGGGVSPTVLVGCPAATSFLFSDSYIMNDPDNNEWLHIEPLDVNRHVIIHETHDLDPSKNTIDVVGMIIGTDFTFKITKTNGGTLQPGSFSTSIHGIVTFTSGENKGQSCETDAFFSGFFTVGGGG